MRKFSLLTGLLLLFGACLALSASSAMALSKHGFSTSFSGSGSTALTNPSDVAVDPSTGSVYVSNTPEDNRQAIQIDASGGSFTLTFDGEETSPITVVNNSGIIGEKIDEALSALPAIGVGNVRTFSFPEIEKHYVVIFEGELANTELAELTANPSGLTGGTSSIQVSTREHGASSADVEKFGSTGTFGFIAGKDVNRTKVEDAGSTEAERNVCTVQSGDVCQPGTPGDSPGAYEGTSGITQIGQGQHYSTYFSRTANQLYLAVDPSSGDLYVGDPGAGEVTKLDPQGNLVTAWGTGGRQNGSGLSPQSKFKGGVGDINALNVRPDGTLRVTLGEGGTSVITGLVSKWVVSFAPDGTFLGAESTAETLQTIGIFGDTIDPLTHERYFIEDRHFSDPMVVTHDAPSGELFEQIGEGDLVTPQGVALDPTSGELYVADSGNRRIAVFESLPDLPDAIPAATGVTPETERLEGDAKRVGAGPITGCYFEYGVTKAYGSGQITCDPSASSGSPFNDVTTGVSAEVSGFESATSYHFRLVVENENGQNSSYDDTFTTLPQAPTIESLTGQAFAETALVRALVNPGGGATTFRVEFVSQEHFESDGFANASSTQLQNIAASRSAQEIVAHLNGLTPETKYRYRVIAENAYQTVETSEHLFTTLPFVFEPREECANSHVRQQTSAAQLLDCRAYELVSASHAAGYDVESNVVPGQSPFPAYPEAEGRVLYGVHSGGIPGTDHPTNRGVDPYVAVRGSDGWSTEYVGVPADNPFSNSPFSSKPSGADASLETFAFGGPGGCSPCFEGGYTGIPVRTPSGSLEQGMVSSEVEPPNSSFKSDGHIVRDISSNGEHLIFASTTLFAPGGNDETGDISIYDRNLRTKETRVVSNRPGAEDLAEPLECLQGEGKCDAAEGDADGLSELAISGDGSRILIGQKVGEDAEGNPYWHLYMDINDGLRTVDLTPGVISERGGPGFTTGVLFDGMTADGSRVFFSTSDQLISEDEDESPDLFVAEVGEASAELNLVSTNSDGIPSNNDACEPTADTVRQHWNSIEAEEESCGVVAVGGGGGVAVESGAVYFLSPEQLQPGKGIQNAPNLYMADAGAGPIFVATLESSATAPLPPSEHRFKSSFGSFEDPTGVAVSEAPGEAGDTYVLDLTNQEAKGNVRKYNPAGEPVSSFGTGGKITGTPPFAEINSFGIATTIAVDNDPSSASYGDLYVPNTYEEVVEKFSPSGAFLGSFGAAFPTAVAVDPATGEVFALSAFGEVSVFDDGGNPLRSFPTLPTATSIAVSPAGEVYVVNGGPLTTEIFGGTEEGEVYTSSGTPERTIEATHLLGVAVDPQTEDLYVDEGGKVAEFDPSGNQVGTPTGAGRLSGSVGLAAFHDELYVSDRGPGPETGKVDVFGGSVLPSDRETDNPLVVDSVSAPEVRHTADFQTNPSGNQAVFPSVRALGEAGEETGGHTEVFRYDAPSGGLACVSCTLSGFPPLGESGLAPNGLSLTDEGRVFFDSGEALLAADTDERQDVYEWEPEGKGNCTASSAGFLRGACLALVSAGTSTFDSGLLSATSSGKDVYFFTRDGLAPQDENGPAMKIYDARENGGFPFLLPQAGCRSSDECHGAASQLPPQIENGAESGIPHNLEKHPKPRRCPKGKVRRHGACVHKKHHKHRSRKHGRGGHK